MKNITSIIDNQSIRFECTTNGSHKFYDLEYTRVTLTAGRFRYRIDATWGPIGGNPREVNKYEGTSYSRAYNIWHDTIAQKEKKGYIEVGGKKTTKKKGIRPKTKLSKKASRIKEEEDLEKIRRELEEDRFGDLEI